MTGQPMPWLPVSLTPYATLNSLLGIISPLALFCAILRLGAFRASWLSAALLAGAIAGIFLGALQLAAPGAASAFRMCVNTSTTMSQSLRVFHCPQGISTRGR